MGTEKGYWEEEGGMGMKRRLADLAAASLCLAAIGITLLYPEQVRGRGMVLAASAAMLVFFLILAGKDRGRELPDRQVPGSIPSEAGLITEIVLLNEEDQEVMLWDLYGKAALVIGRDKKENQVDIDLSQSAYASMVDIEHAVLNYSAGSWYVEDLGSANGIRVKKAEDGKVYKLLADTPCRLGRGDCLYIGLNRLLLR